MAKLDIKPGMKFNKLTVVEELEKLRLPSGQTNRYFLCKCDCGDFTKVRLVHLCRGRIKTCGCAHGEKHGESHSNLYRVWRAIRDRCAKNYFQKHLYYDKGISVCNEWRKSYISFRDWAKSHGYKYGLQIDRIKNDLGYFPENCRFVNQIENQANRDNTVMIKYDGENIALMTVIRKKGLFFHSDAIRSRIHRGWSAQKAIDTPIRAGNYKRND